MKKIILILAFGFGLLMSNKSLLLAAADRPCERDVCEYATGHCKFSEQWYSCAQTASGGCKERQCSE